MHGNREFFPLHRTVSGFVSERGEHIRPVLSSEEWGLQNVLCEYYCLPTCDFPEQRLQRHVLAIYLSRPTLLEVSQDSKIYRGHALSGGVTLTPAGMRCRSRSKHGQEILRLSIDPVFADQISIKSGGNVGYAPQVNVLDPLIYQVGLVLKSELELKAKANVSYFESLINTLILHLSQRYSLETMRKQTTCDSSLGLPERKLQHLLSFIESNLDQELMISDMADALQMNLHHFARAFKKSMQQSPHRYLQSRRMALARRLIEEGLTGFEVMEQIGMKSQSHFIRAFKDYTSMTPMEYQRVTKHLQVGDPE
jgi:AraC family transcriptional regulator